MSNSFCLKNANKDWLDTTYLTVTLTLSFQTFSCLQVLHTKLPINVCTRSQYLGLANYPS